MPKEFVSHWSDDWPPKEPIKDHDQAEKMAYAEKPYVDDAIEVGNLAVRHADRVKEGYNSAHHPFEQTQEELMREADSAAADIYEADIEAKKGVKVEA